MEIGLNLYSVRNLIETEEAYEKTTETLREMGYAYVQYSGGPFDAERIRRVREKTGMPVVLTHAPLDRILGDTDALMREHESFGCRRIGLGYLPVAYDDEKAWKKKIDDLERVARIMQERGFTFFYHNHQHEFLRFGGQTIFNYMIENAPHVHFTLDTYWAHLGGEDVLRLAEKLTGRIECVHLKDYKMQAENGEVRPHFAPLGCGNLDFRAIVQNMRAAGTRYFLVEQDDAALLPDTLEQVRISAQYATEVL